VASRSLRQRLRDGETLLGASCAYGSPMVAEVMAGAGLDYIYLDQQHGLTSFDTLVHMLRALRGSPTTPIVRVLDNDAKLIGQALDAGAEGVIIPMVNSRVDAERAAAACRYAPLGMRSFGPVRGGVVYGRDTTAANERTLCLVMIETAEGVAAADEIARVQGIDGVYIGQADLALSLGLEALVKIQPGVHADAIDAIRKACRTAGIAVGINGDPKGMAAEGYRIITVGSDMAIVNAGVAQLIERRQSLPIAKSNR
jgi:4-hydroxy-2-oxoheptanedioate aldolase